MAINVEKLREELLLAEQGDIDARAVVAMALAPTEEDSIDEIAEKMKYFRKLFFGGSLKYKDAHFHLEIERVYAEQIYFLIHHGRPRYKGLVIVGFRESAKTSTVKFCETYLSVYIPRDNDLTHIVSEDGTTANQFNMDLFNMFGFSKLAMYFPNLIAQSQEKKKESQTMARFTTTTGVTYGASGARKSKRGAVQVHIDEKGEVESKRPKKVIADDIENETTLLSLAVTDHIYQVLQASFDGLDQSRGWWVILGNYLSLRGTIAKFMNKYRDDRDVAIISIPLLLKNGEPSWPDKYTPEKIASIKRSSDNFETEYMNNPKRSMAYFDTIPDEIEFVTEESRDAEGLLTILPPESDAAYIMSIDSATGVGRDESSFTILKTTGLRYDEVANFKSKTIRPESFAGVCARVATQYNLAFMIPENNYPGNETIAFLQGIYKNIYKNPDGFYGVATTSKSKPEMLVNAKKIFKEKLLTVRSRALYQQIAEYPASDVHTISQRDGSGGHFDMLIALIIGLKYGSAISVDQNSTAVDAMLAKSVDKIFEKDVHAW